MMRDTMRDMAKAIFIRHIRAYGHDDVLDLTKYNSKLNIQKCPIVSIEYVEASDDIVFHLKKDDEEDFTLFSDYQPKTMYYAANILRGEMRKVLEEKINVVNLENRLPKEK